MSAYIKAAVRIENGKHIMFWYEGNELHCYTVQDQHNTSSIEYMRSLTLASDDVAQEFIKRYNKDSGKVDDFVMNQVKRLTRRTS